MVVLKVLTRSRLRSREEAGAMLGLLAEAIPAAAPRIWGNYEPIDQPFELADVLKRWDEPFLWIGEDERVGGSINMALYKHERGSILVEVPAEVARAAAAAELVKTLARQFTAEFGCLHHVTQEGIDAGLGLAQLGQAPDPSFHDLKRAIPYLYWATVFGPAYTDYFGRERVASVPAALVERLASDIFYVQLTERLSDVEDHFAEFAEAQRAAINHLGADSFFDPRRPWEHQYAVPSFPELP